MSCSSTDESAAIGKDSERLFLKAFQEAGWKPPQWYRSIRPATGLEDSEGYDFFILTDRGEVPIQVKSSRTYIRKYRLRHPESTAIIIVVKAGYSAARIRGMTIEAIGKRRSGVEMLRTGAWSVPERGFDG